MRSCSSYWRCSGVRASRRRIVRRRLGSSLSRFVLAAKQMTLGTVSCRRARRGTLPRLPRSRSWGNELKSWSARRWLEGKLRAQAARRGPKANRPRPLKVSRFKPWILPNSEWGWCGLRVFSPEVKPSFSESESRIRKCRGGRPRNTFTV